MITMVYRIWISKIGFTPERRGLASRWEIGSQRLVLHLPRNIFPAGSSMLADQFPENLRRSFPACIFSLIKSP
jgi:hypothetical protein